MLFNISMRNYTSKLYLIQSSNSKCFLSKASYSTMQSANSNTIPTQDS